MPLSTIGKRGSNLNKPGCKLPGLAPLTNRGSKLVTYIRVRTNKNYSPS
jgi:hypothetical protein